MDREERWERTRAKGFLRFVAEVGILRFGVPVVIVMKTINCLYTYFFTAKDIATLFTGREFLFMLVGVVFEGVFFGVCLWIYGDRKFPSVR